jgi:methylphosphotriester-DNA--protein-cysteine methyltransferase
MGDRWACAFGQDSTSYGTGAAVTTEPLNTELSVRTESIQSLYTRYRAHRFNVNRRYQRKLVWSVEEKAPRYFHCLFMAIFEMMFNDNMRLKDPSGAAQRLVNSSTSVLKIAIGSAWTGDSKRDSIDSIKGVMAAYFERSSDTKDLAQFGHASHIEKLLANAKVEQ